MTRPPRRRAAWGPLAGSLITFSEGWRLIASPTRQASWARTRSWRSATTAVTRNGYKAHVAGRSPSVVEVELVLVGDPIPVLVGLLEHGREEGVDDALERRDLGAKALEFPQNVLVG